MTKCKILQLKMKECFKKGKKNEKSSSRSKSKNQPDMIKVNIRIVNENVPTGKIQLKSPKNQVKRGENGIEKEWNSNGTATLNREIMLSLIGVSSRSKSSTNQSNRYSFGQLPSNRSKSSLTKSQTENSLVDNASMEDSKTMLPIALERKTLDQLDTKMTIEQKLNEGLYEEIYKGRDNKTGDPWMVTIVNLTKLNKTFNKQFIPRTILELVGIKHDFIIQIYNIIHQDDKLFVFMPFANGGNLADYLKKNGPLSKALACHWFTHVCKALNYLHNGLKIAHRNIKAENVLLQDNIAKLTDFLFAKVVAEGGPIKCPIISKFGRTLYGSMPYFSPQMLKRLPYNAQASDMWAMGVLLYLMLNNAFPFDPNDETIMLLEQTKPIKLDKNITAELNNLYKQLFEYEEKFRMTAEKILGNLWIIKNRGRIFFQSQIDNKQTS